MSDLQTTNFWTVLDAHIHRYDPGNAPDRLVSLRLSALTAGVQENSPEIYHVSSSEGRIHGSHRHEHKLEVMNVVVGAWRLELIGPDRETRWEGVVSEDDDITWHVLPGTWHRVTPVTERAVLLVCSSTVHDDANPDMIPDWPE